MPGVNLKQALKAVLPAEDLARLVRGYDVVGDVAVIIIPPELDAKRHQICRALLENAPTIRVVARRAGQYGGEYRKIQLEKICGTGGLETLHNEYGIRLHLDPGQVYFSPRSGGERARLAASAKPGEHVLVMFSGIAALPLMYSLRSPAESILGIEKNPVAHGYAIKNMAANRKANNIRLVLGDVEEVVPYLKMKFNRIAMPLPSAAREFAALALQSLEEGGMIHYYAFQKKGEFTKAVDELQREIRTCGRTLVSAEIHKCGHVSPSKYRICVDALIR